MGRKGRGRGGGDDRVFDSRRGFSGVWVQPLGLGGELFLTEGHSFVLVDKPKGKERDCVGYTSPLKQLGVYLLPSGAEPGGPEEKRDRTVSCDLKGCFGGRRRGRGRGAERS